jgi:acyl-CoA thioesterase I
MSVDAEFTRFPRIALSRDRQTRGGSRFTRVPPRIPAQEECIVSHTRITAFVAFSLICCLLSPAGVMRVREDATAWVSSAVRFAQPQPGPDSSLPASASPLRGCETRIEQTTHRAPTAAIVGASYTAGVGPDNPEQSWAVQLTRELRWNAVVYGVSGAGFANSGLGATGSMSGLLAAEDLPRLNPALVIVQAGFNDNGVPQAVEASRVRAVIDQIRAAAPNARVALLTTFSFTADGTPALRATDQTIVAAARAADPGVIVMDPLAGRWQFERASDGLHPTAAGDQWIAHRVAAILASTNIRAARAGGPSPTVCDAAVGADGTPDA